MIRHHFKFRPVLAAVLILPLFIFLMVEIAIIPFVGRQIMAQKEQGLRQAVEVAYGIIEVEEKQIHNTHITLAEAQERAKQSLKEIRYNGNDYFWISDTGKPEPQMIMHPTEPTLTGKLLDAPEFHSATGLRYGLDGLEKSLNSINLFVAFTEVAENAKHGYVTYVWTKPTPDGGTTKDVYQKISYVKFFQPWGWVVGSGVYIDGVQKEAAKLRTPVYSATLLFTIFLVIVSYWLNIAKRKQVEQSLRESRELFTLLMQSSPIYIFIKEVSPDGSRVLQASENFKQILGMPGPEMVGKTMEELFPADLAAKITADDLAVISQGEALQFDEAFNGRNYTTIKFPLILGDKSLLAGYTIDITARLQAEAELRLQSAALQAAANAIVITDCNGTIEWVNPAFSELTGYSAEEAKGKNPRELIKSGVHDQFFYKGLWKTLLNGEVWRGEMINRHKDDTHYPEGQTITPVKDSEGVITHFIAIKRNLTEQHKLEEQLRQSQKMESLGTLAGGIAHDFNNILTAISGYGQLSLMKLATGDPLRCNIENMLEAVDRAVRLTRQMLMFSSKQVSHKKAMELNNIIINVKKFLQRVIGEDIEIETNLAASPLYLQADANQLEQVLMNLAVNASHAMPQGGTLMIATEPVTLESPLVSAYGSDSPGPYVLMSVSDSGCGMDEATRQRIFEPFFTTKDLGKGTGLGLSVVYGIIKDHGGYIDVASEPGKGSTFRIYLPLTAEMGVEERPKTGGAISGGSETILLAEDDKMVREMTRVMLTEFGYAVITAEDGADAVRKFTEQRATIDLLLFDLIMPKMNGQEALDEIRKVRSDIKVIFSSGYAPETLHQKFALAAGAFLIVKPVPPAELLRKVRSVLDETSPCPLTFPAPLDPPV